MVEAGREGAGRESDVFSSNSVFRSTPILPIINIGCPRRREDSEVNNVKATMLLVLRETKPKAMNLVAARITSLSDVRFFFSSSNVPLV